MRLVVQDLSRSYEASAVQVAALRGVNFEIEAGEFVAIVGSSGSGKTTLLNSVGGLDTRFSGEVKLGERSLQKLSEKELARYRRDHFGYVFQHFNLLGHLSVLENVLLPTFFGSRSPGESRKRAEGLLARVGLADRGPSMPGELSGGQRQRVAIARALINAPSILLCDEPTGSLDRETGLEIMALFEELNRDEGITLIVITHEPYIAGMARRRITMLDGRIESDDLQSPEWPDRPEGRP